MKEGKKRGRGRPKKVAVKTPAPKTEQKKTGGRHEAVGADRKIIINESVGVHFRVSSKETAPTENSIVTVKIGRQEIPLIVRNVKLMVNGDTLIQAFVQKGQGHHKILGEHKGEFATVAWEGGAK